MSHEDVRSAYSTSGGIEEVFSSKVADYVASRPSYPLELIDYLGEFARLNSDSLVADVGAGTGILTRLLLDRGCRVVAVEPNDPMRAAADAALCMFDTYSSVNGTAEKMTVPDGSLDLITAAQAFHWFRVDEARKEFKRVLKPGGVVALIWNDRLLSDPVHVAIDEVFNEFGGEKRYALINHESQRDITGLFGTATPVEQTFANEHQLSLEGLKSLLFSRSYMPDRGSELGRLVGESVEKVFNRFQVSGEVTVRYVTSLSMHAL